MVRDLRNRGVIVTEKPEGIRVATHFFNSEDEIEKLVAAMDETKKANTV